MPARFNGPPNEYLTPSNALVESFVYGYDGKKDMVTLENIQALSKNGYEVKDLS